MSNVKVSFSPGARAVSLPSELTVYTDEQGQTVPAGHTDFAIGLAFFPTNLNPDPVTAALARRRAGDDHRCIKRSYFHASADCTPCRDLSATAIRDAVGDVFFSSLRWRFERTSPDHPNRGELHRHAIALALNHIAQGHGVRQIRLLFAKVQGLSEQSLHSRLQDEDHDVHLRLMTSNLGMPPHSFLRVVPEPVEGHDPGIQLVDRMLWQERRDARVLEESLGLMLEYEVDTDGPFVIRHYVKHDTTLSVVPRRPFGRALDAVSTEEKVFAIREIERTVHRVALEDPAETRHLIGRVRVASARILDKSRIGLEDLWAVCRAFLLVVDTLPVYIAGDEASDRAASEAAALAAAIIQAHESWTVSLADHWIERRAWIINSGNGDSLNSRQTAEPSS